MNEPTLYNIIQNGINLKGLETSLKPHQLQAVRKALGKTTGVLLRHGLGSGKTITSIGIANALGMPTDVVLPAALMPNYEKEIERHTSKERPPYNLYSLEYIIRHPEALQNGPNRTLVVDEAHRLRNSKGKAYKIILEAPHEKKVLLSATPIYNTPEDLVGLLKVFRAAKGEEKTPVKMTSKYITPKKIPYGIEMGDVNKWFDRESEIPEDYPDYKKENIRKMIGRVDRYLRKHVHTYEKKNTDDFPSVTEEDVYVPMSSNQLKAFRRYQKRTFLDDLFKTEWNKKKNIDMSILEHPSQDRLKNPFFIKTRQVANIYKDESPKIDKMVEDIKKTKGKVVSYSNFIDAGLKPLAKKLDEENIPYELFSGEQTKDEKRQIVEDYNNDKIKALLLSSAGSEGLDLKRTKLIQLMEPHFHEEKTKQIVGRGVRYKSHEGLPKKDQHVTVKHYLSTIPGKPNMHTTDTFLKALGEFKNKRKDFFLDKMGVK